MTSQAAILVCLVLWLTDYRHLINIYATRSVFITMTTPFRLNSSMIPFTVVGSLVVQCASHSGNVTFRLMPASLVYQSLHLEGVVKSSFVFKSVTSVYFCLYWRLPIAPIDRSAIEARMVNVFSPFRCLFDSPTHGSWSKRASFPLHVFSVLALSFFYVYIFAESICLFFLESVPLPLPCLRVFFLHEITRKSAVLSFFSWCDGSTPTQRRYMHSPEQERLSHANEEMKWVGDWR